MYDQTELGNRIPVWPLGGYLCKPHVFAELEQGNLWFDHGDYIPVLELFDTEELMGIFVWLMSIKLKLVLMFFYWFHFVLLIFSISS